MKLISTFLIAISIFILWACTKNNEAKESATQLPQVAAASPSLEGSSPQAKAEVEYFTENEENCAKIKYIAPADEANIAKAQGASITSVHFYKSNWAPDAFGKLRCMITVDTGKGPLKCPADRFIKSDDGTWGTAVLDNNAFLCI